MENVEAIIDAVANGVFNDPAVNPPVNEVVVAHAHNVPEDPVDHAQPAPNVPVPPVPINDIHVVPQQPPLRRGQRNRHLPHALRPDGETPALPFTGRGRGRARGGHRL